MPRSHRTWIAVPLSGLTAATLTVTSPDTDASAAMAPAQTAAQATEAFDPSQMPTMDVRTRKPGRAPGLLFITPQHPRVETLRGPLIVDERGRPVWHHPVGEKEFATNLQVQTYRGEEVLTWWEGTSTNTGLGRGEGYILDENYNIIETVETPDPGQALGVHEFRLTPQGTALAISYQPKPADLSEVGGPQDGTVYDCVIQEIDVATGKKVMEWSSLEHVPVTESEVRPESGSSEPFDYLHANSVSLDTDGNLLISGHHSNTVYKVDRETGEIIWRLGGRQSDFRLGVGARTIGQHDAQAEGQNTYRIFDNQNSGLPGYESRVAWIKVDNRRKQAKLVRQEIHPDFMSAGTEGGTQPLPGGNTFVSWGSAGSISEFTPDGTMVFDAKFLPEPLSSFRAYRSPWKGLPDTDPEVTVDADAGKAHAIWNGATEVDRWRLLGGETEDDLEPVAKADWNGLDTAVRLPDHARDADYVQVQALDDDGRVIGTSTVTPADGAQSG